MVKFSSNSEEEREGNRWSSIMNRARELKEEVWQRAGKLPNREEDGED